MNLGSFDFAMAAGLSGVALYLISYALLQLRIIIGNGYIYPLMNTGAAVCVMISLMRDFNIASALIQISFIAISAVGIFRLFYVRNQIRFSKREQALLNDKFKKLPNDIAKEFFKAGEWLDAPAGATLSETGEPISHLYYLEKGQCDVTVGSKKVGMCNKGDFVGEITCFNRETATGTVRSKGDISLFRVEAEKLRALCKDNPELRFEIERGMADNLRLKVARSNGLQTAATPNPKLQTMSSNFLN